MQWEWSWSPLLFDGQRAMVTRAVEEATGEALSTIDPLPDTLIARAQEVGLAPVYLLMWIGDREPETGWSAEAMLAWGREKGALKT